jgi:hypothetical protein
MPSSKFSGGNCLYLLFNASAFERLPNLGYNTFSFGGYQEGPGHLRKRARQGI